MNRSKMPPWPAVPLSFAMEIARTEGAYIYTADGEKMLDAGSQACASNIGYGRKEVANAIAEATAECTHVIPPFATSNRLKLVETLKKDWLPEELSRIHFVNSGSEAADTAIKLARQHHFHAGNTSKWKVIGRQFSYHGVTIGGLSVSGHSDRRVGMDPLLCDFPLAPACYPYRCDDCSVSSGCKLSCVDAVEEIILREGADTIAAFIAEPIVGTSGGALVPHDDYWPRIQKLCRKYNILLILDEVITGFGRTGKRFALEHWNIKPDILTSAKGFSGGYAPIAMVATTERVIAPLIEKGDFIMFHTFGGHNGACAAALKVLEILERENLLERSAVLGAYLGERLGELRDHPFVGDVRGKGMLWAVEVVKDKSTGECWPASDNVTFSIIFEGARRGVLYYFGGTGDNGDIICFGPPYIVTREEIDLMVETLGKSIDAVTERALAG